MEYYRYEHTKLAYEVIGEGTPVLFLHGWGMDHRLMSGCFERIFGKYNLEYKRYYVDLPGMGRSKASKNIKRSDDILKVLHAFAEDVIGESFILAGESYGGYLARGFVHENSSMVQSLILLCPLVYPGYRTGRVEEHRIVKKDDEFLATLTKEEYDSFTYLNVILLKDVWEKYQTDIMPALAEQDHHFLDEVLEGAFTFDVDYLIEPFKKPCLILVGKQDTEVGYKDQFGLLSSYPKATYCAVHGAGHNLQIEQADYFCTIVLNWLSELYEEEEEW